MERMRMEWISVKDRLPTEERQYLCQISSTKGDYYLLLDYKNNTKEFFETDEFAKRYCCPFATNWRKDARDEELSGFIEFSGWDSDFFFHDDVVAWMPLPAPYIEDFGALDTMYSKDELWGIR